ncbi:hypothetical protein D0Y65_024715 [Glycine soja]|uniref:Uncharacterized protein n=1 Tax=Glycine soja TaxID=3848 RepID=A0A445J3K5_GLYSO|nr:hypothetical protein D0Y65_024715 [Glycine soja]
MNVYEEMEEAKAEIEKLTVKLRDKTNSLQNLKKYYDAQANKIQESIFKVEKLNQEMLQKADDINDYVSESLNNKESITKHLSAADDELGAICDDKFRKWKDEKRGYVLALEEEEQIKWKEEHFKHLEDVHEKLIDQFKASKKEWELEKSTLLDEISSLKSFSKKYINEEREKAACLMRQVESYGFANELLHLPHNELDRHKDLHMEDGFKEQLKEVYDALDRANIELDERICEKSEMEFELRIWKSFVERLRNGLEENLVMCKELENSLLAQVDFTESLKQEKDSLVFKLEEKENKIECLQQHVYYLNKNQKDISPDHRGEGQYFRGAPEREVCDKITAAEVLATLEIEEKLMMVELEYDIHDMEQKLKLQEENWRQSEQLALDIEEEMEAKQLQIKKLIDQMENKLRGSDVFLQKLKIENRSLLENVTRLSLESALLQSADTQLMDTLRSIVQCFENDSVGINFTKDDGLLVKENMIMHSPTGIKKLETFSDIRSLFKELNT